MYIKFYVSFYFQNWSSKDIPQIYQQFKSSLSWSYKKKLLSYLNYFKAIYLNYSIKGSLRDIVTESFIKNLLYKRQRMHKLYSSYLLYKFYKLFKIKYFLI